MRSRRYHARRMAPIARSALVWKQRATMKGMDSMWSIFRNSNDIF